MQTVLALHSDSRIEPFLARASSSEFSFRPFSLADYRSEQQLLQVLPPQVQLAHCVLVDLVSLNILGKWILDWLSANHPGVPVVVRLSPDQLAMAELPQNYIFVFDTDPIDRVRQQIGVFVNQNHLAKEVQYLKETVSRRAQLSPASGTRGTGSPGLHHPYREAFIDMSRLLGNSGNVKSLAEQALPLVSEMFGIGKLAIFIREREAGVMKQGLPGLPHGRLLPMASIGVPREITLSIDSGIGRQATTQGKIVRREPFADSPLAVFDPQVQKEFEVLGTEFAAPILDLDTTLGVLTFAGKVTGEPFASEELELVFNLMNQLGMMIRNIWLHQDLLGQQSFMQDVLTHIESGVVVINSHNKIAALNRRAAELLGASEVGAVGADASWLPSQIADLLFATSRTGETHSHREVNLQKSGRALSVSTSRFNASAEDARSEASCFAVAVIQDITQMKEQHALAREMDQQEFILQLASRLSHELKNSLVSINTFAQLLPQQYDRKEFRDEFFKIVAHEVTRVDMLVENLTFFAHPLLLHCEEVDLAELIEQAVTRLVEEHRRQHEGAVVSTTSGQPTISSLTGQPIILGKRCSHTSKKFECDPKWLALALHNIMRNAIQSMPHGGRLSVITDDAKPNGHIEPRIQISVIDTGEGIPLTHLEQIFQPFFTTRNVGVGLGLTISQRIVHKHGGKILVESKLGKGTTMVITLPTKAAPVTNEATPAQEKQPARLLSKPLEFFPRS